MNNNLNQSLLESIWVENTVDIKDVDLDAVSVDDFDFW